MQTPLESVFKYVASDESEKQFYLNIIIKINEISKELQNNIDNPSEAESLYTQMMQYVKNIESLVMLRKLYISGIIDSPRSSEHVLTETKDPV